MIAARATIKARIRYVCIEFVCIGGAFVWYPVVLCVIDAIPCAGPTKSAGSISTGCGARLKSNEFIMSFALTSLVRRVGRLKFSSANLRSEANSYCVWSRYACLAQGEITKVGTLNPSPKASTCGGCGLDPAF